MRPIVNMPEEDRATDMGNMHKKLLTVARVVPEISCPTDRDRQSQTDRQTHSPQYFASTPAGYAKLRCVAGRRSCQYCGDSSSMLSVSSWRLVSQRSRRRGQSLAGISEWWCRLEFVLQMFTTDTSNMSLRNTEWCLRCRCFITLGLKLGLGSTKA